MGACGYGLILRHRFPHSPDELSPVLYQGCGFLRDGRAHGGTNNVAEYLAIIASIKAAKQLGATDLEVYSDSNLAVNQLTNRHKTSANHLVELLKEAREAARGLRVAYYHLLRGSNSLADKAANKAMDDKADSASLSEAGRALLHRPRDAEEGVGCPRPKPPAPWIYPEQGGEGQHACAANDPGAGCVVCGDPFPSSAFGAILACDCGSPLPASALVCGKFCHVGCAELDEAPTGDRPFYCPLCTSRHGAAPDHALGPVATCATCSSPFRPPHLNHKSCPTCMAARGSGGGGRGRGGGGARGGGGGRGRGGGRGSAGRDLSQASPPAADGPPVPGPIRAPPPFRGPPSPLTFALPMAQLLRACGPKGDPAWLLDQLAHVRPPVILTVPAPARLLLQSVLRSILTAALQAEGAAAGLAWCLLLSLPSLLLSATPASDRSSCTITTSIKANVQDLKEGNLAALIDRAADRARAHHTGICIRRDALDGLPPAAHVNIQAERAAKCTTKHVLAGHVGQGVRCLDRAPPAPSGKATRDKLNSLHPAAPPRDAARWEVVLSPIEEDPIAPPEYADGEEAAAPDFSPLLKYLKSHRGGAGGPDSLTAGLLLDIVGTRNDLLELLQAAVEAIQRARAPQFIMSELANATLYALGKKAAPAPQGSPDEAPPDHRADHPAPAPVAAEGPVSGRTRQAASHAASGLGGAAAAAASLHSSPPRSRAPQPKPTPGSAADPGAATAEMRRGMRDPSGGAPSAPPAPAVGVRPIAIGSILRRLAARLLLARNTSEVEEALGTAQYGFTPAGRESIMLQINTLLDLHPDWIVAGLDIKNAFNTVSRLVMLEECRTRLPHLFALARACYADPSTLFYRDDDGFHDISSASGSQQGDPFGGVLFALAYRTVLDRLQVAFPDLHVFCFWDDTSLVGPADLVSRAIAWLNSEEGAIQVDLTYNEAKLQAWSPTELPPTHRSALSRVGVGAANLAPPARGIEMLGVFLGSPEYIKAGLARKLAKLTAVLEGEAWHKLEPRVQLLCLVYAISRRAHDSARFARPDLLHDAGLTHDKAIAGALSNIIGFLPNHTTTDTLELVRFKIRLPLKMGGLGLRLLQDASLPAYVSSLLDGRTIALARLNCSAGHRDAEVRAALRGFAAIRPPTFTSVPRGDSNPTAAGGTVGHILQHYLADLALRDLYALSRSAHLDNLLAAAPGMAPAHVDVDKISAKSRIPFALRAENIADLGDNTRHFQQRLQRVIDEGLLSRLLLLFYRGYGELPPGEAGDAKRAAAHALRHQLEGVSDRGAGAWLLAAPDGNPRFRHLLQLSSQEFRTALQLRLGLPLNVLIAADVEAPGEGGTCPLLKSSNSGGVAAAPARSRGRPRSLRKALRKGRAGAPVPAAAANDVDLDPPLEGEGEAAVDPRDAPTTTPSRPQSTSPTPSGICGQPLNHHGRHLLRCACGGGLKARHDRIARVLALIAPRGTTGLCAYLPVSATADENKVYKLMCTLAAERPDPSSADPDGTSRWNKPDVYVPPHERINGGRPAFVDVTVVQGDAPGRLGAYTPAEDLLLAAEVAKTNHYKEETAPGGPFCHALFVPFVLETGGRLGIQADALLKSWARLAAGDDMDQPKMSTLATFILRQYREAVGVTLQRGNALMVQRAVGDLGQDGARPLSLSDASGGGHLPDFFGVVAGPA